MSNKVQESQALKDEIRALRLRRRLAEEKARTAAAGLRTAVLAESLYGGAGFGEQWGDFVDPRGRFPREEGFLSGHLDVDVTQRRRGAPYVAFQTLEELREIWSLSRHIADRNAWAVGAIRGLGGYLIRSGMTSNAVLRPGVDETERTKGYVKAVQAELDAFDADAVWPEMEIEILRRAIVHGEAPVRCFSDNGADDESILQVRFIEAEQIVNPPQEPDGPEWAFGVQADPEDQQTFTAFGINYSGEVDDHEVVPAGEIEQYKTDNVGRAVRRGLSDFFPVSENVEELRKLLRAMRKGGTLLASIAWWEKFATATKSEVQAMEEGLATLKAQRATGVQGTQRQEVRYRQIDPGAIIKTDADREVVPPPLAQNTPHFAELVRLCRMAFSHRWNIPESFWDASNGAFASLTVAESPFVVTAEQQQWFYARRHRRIKIRAVKHAIKKGRLPEDVLGYVDVEVAPAPLVVRNQQEAATVASTRLKDGVTSPQRVAQENGEDWEQVQSERQQAIEAGWTPPSDALGMPPAPEGAGLGLPVNGAPVVEPPTERTAAPGDTADALALAGDLQASALNGAQITSLLAVTDKVAAGSLTPDAAIAILTQAFPTMDPAKIAELVNKIKVGAPVTEHADPFAWLRD